MRQDQTLKLFAYALIFVSGIAFSNLFAPTVPVVDIETINYQRRIAELELKLSKSKASLKIFKEIDSELLKKDKKLHLPLANLKRKRRAIFVKRKKLEQELKIIDRGEG